MITFEDIKNNADIRTYIQCADESLAALGFTEHSFAHVTRVAETAKYILETLGYSEHEVELARIAGFMHDIGNVVNRHDHAISGATMAFRILDKMGMEPADVAAVITAIGHHDDSTAFPVNAVAAALILADKTDVRRSRVRNKDMATFDIHDRVNYSVERSEVLLDVPVRTVIGEDGHITIPHFYDDVEEVPAAEREMIAQIPFDEKKYMEAIGVKALKGEKGYSTLERNSCRPSFDICGIWGGYTGEGSKTVLPSKAYAKVSCRLVPHQNHAVISQLFVDYIQSIAPEYVQVKVTPMHGGEGYVCPITLPAYQAAEKGFAKAFGKKPLAVRRGGSIPIISDFEQILGIKTVLMGFGLESDAIHSPNENFSLDIFRKGIEAVVEFHLNY